MPTTLKIFQVHFQDNQYLLHPLDIVETVPDGAVIFNPNPANAGAYQAADAAGRLHCGWIGIDELDPNDMIYSIGAFAEEIGGVNQDRLPKRYHMNGLIP